ncbi:MAG: ABC transporter permease [Dysgonamonadaceae bacterium]|jgi:ABC-2 type transport system permease protein|nr:ABC transporter permease [Dysgonamonadaceae bacterium]
MSKIGIVIQREYTSRVRKKSFLLLTFLMPVMFVALIFVPLYLSSIKDNTVKNIVIYDETGKYFSVFKDTDNYHFIEGGNQVDVSSEIKNNESYATLVITNDLIQNSSAVTLFSTTQVTMEDKNVIIRQLNEFLSEEKLNSFNIPNLKEIIEDSKISVNLQTIKWDESGKETISSSEVATVIGMVFTIIIYMFIFVYGAMVMQGVLEEKTNRIVEVMVSSVKPFQFMMGKIIGIGLVGLTQFFLWVTLIVAIVFVASISLATTQIDAEMIMSTTAAVQDLSTVTTPELSKVQEIFGMVSSINFPELVFYFIVFFIGGYMIYASLFAAIGSMVNAQEDTQQFMLPITLLILFSLYAGMYSVQNPNGPLAFWTSIIPLSSPIVMMVRLPFGIPIWEKLLSVGLLFATVFLMVKLSAKIYRTGILMYGKKPNLKEIWKWLRY